MVERGSCVIIGSGVIGCATAYYLAKRGMRDIVLVEKDYLASGATGRCGGGVRQQWSAPDNVRLAMGSVRLFEGLSEELGVDIEWNQGGYLVLTTTQDELDQFGKTCEMQRGLGLDVDLVSPEEAKEIVPVLNTDGILGGTFCPTDGHANPFLVVYGYARAAERLGVRIELRRKVQGIELQGGKVTAVVTDRGRIESPLVVNAAGGHSGEIGKMVGLDLPVESYRHEILATEPLNPLFDTMVISFDMNIYFSQTASGGIVGGQSNPGEPPGFGIGSSLPFLKQFSRKLVRLIPCLEGVKVVRQWAGLYNVTPDAQPILGGADGVEGYYQAIGFSGHGFMLAPKTAELMAELITEGKTSLPIEGLHMRRSRERGGERSVV